MESLDINQLKELVLFYHKKSADLELQSLERQLAINKMGKNLSEQFATIDALNKTINEMLIAKQEEVIKEQSIKEKNINKKKNTGK